jgi:hypothetical protein
MQIWVNLSSFCVLCQNKRFHISGTQSKNHIEDVETLLLEKGVVKEAIRFEK